MATYYWVGGTGTWNNTSTTNWSATSSGGAGAGPPNSSDTVIFDASSGTGTCTTAATAAASVVTLNSATLGLTLGAAFTMSGLFTLARGALDLGGFQLTCLNFNSDNSNTRSIAFGATGSIKTTIQPGIAWDIRTLTGFTITGSKQLIVQPASGISATTIYHRGTGASESNAISMQVIATSGALIIAGTSIFLNVDFSQFTMTAALNNAAITIYGNLKLGTANTLTSGTNAWTFASTSGTKTFESAGSTFTMPLIFNGVGGTWQLVDDLTIASDRTLTLTNGTLDGNGKNVSSGSFALGAGTKTLTLGSGTWTITGSGASAWNASTNSAGLTVSASTGTISLTSASAKTFAGGGFTWPTLNQGGAGALTITGSSTFANITNTYGATGATTITFTAGTTQTVSQFTASGTVGKLLTLNSSSAGSQFILSDASGFVGVSYCDIKDSNATGGAIWNASTANGNVDSGNNIGWEFTSVYYWVGGSGTWNNTSKTNWSSSSGGAGGFGPPVSVDTINFDSNSGTGTCTTAATAAGSIVTLNSATLGLTLGATFTMSGAFTLTQGTLSLGGFQLSCLNFASTGASTRSIAFGTSGNITVSGSGTTAWNASGSGLTTTGTTSTISMTSASAKTFVGGGYTYAAALNQGGAGTLTISGSNTFDNITNTYGATGATTITFTSGTTQTVFAFTASGTSGKLLTLNSSSAGTRFNLSDPSGAVNVSFCNISDSNATGGAKWNSYLSNGNINSGNNLGWDFSQRGGLSPVPGLSSANGLSLGVGLVGNL